MNRQLAEKLLEKLRTKYPKFPMGNYWNKHGKRRIYFNSDNGNYDFYIDFTKSRIYIGNYKGRYWKKKIPFENFRQLKKEVQILLDQIRKSYGKCPQCDKPARKDGYCSNKCKRESGKFSNIVIFEKGDSITRVETSRNHWGKVVKSYEDIGPADTIKRQVTLNRSCLVCRVKFSTYDKEQYRCNLCIREKRILG